MLSHCTAGRSARDTDVESVMGNIANQTGLTANRGPARLALSLSHVLGEATYEQMLDGMNDEPVLVRYAVETGQKIECDAGFPNPFANWRKS